MSSHRLLVDLGILQNVLSDVWMDILTMTFIIMTF